jgi:preprotein translocase subunit SecD
MMKSRWRRFNHYLLAVALAGLAACQTPEERERSDTTATLRLYLEATPDGTARYQMIELAGVPICASTSPFLAENSVKSAQVINTRDGGYALDVEFDKHGMLVLDSVTGANRGRRMILLTQFGLKDSGQERWLAAPKITTRISGGRLVFTPNATRQEADQIALGLNNVRAETQKDTYFKDE